MKFKFSTAVIHEHPLKIVIFGGESEKKQMKIVFILFLFLGKKSKQICHT